MACAQAAESCPYFNKISGMKRLKGLRNAGMLPGMRVEAFLPISEGHLGQAVFNPARKRTILLRGSPLEGISATNDEWDVLPREKFPAFRHESASSLRSRYEGLLARKERHEREHGPVAFLAVMLPEAKYRFAIVADIDHGFRTYELSIREKKGMTSEGPKGVEAEIYCEMGQVHFAAGMRESEITPIGRTLPRDAEAARYAASVRECMPNLMKLHQGGRSMLRAVVYESMLQPAAYDLVRKP